MFSGPLFGTITSEILKSVFESVKKLAVELEHSLIRCKVDIEAVPS